MHRRTTSAQEALAAAALPDSMPQGRAQQVTSDEEDDAEASHRAAQAHVQAAAATAVPARWNPRETVVQVNEAGERFRYHRNQSIDIVTFDGRIITEEEAFD
jgi:hypothetical protein